MKKTLLLSLSIFSILYCVAQQTIVHDGETREFYTTVPASYDANTPVPLLLCFHGRTSSATTIKSYSGFDFLAESNGFIVVYPQGLLYDGSTHWNVGGFTNGSDVDDLGFSEALLDQLESEYAIDPTRIYTTGMSNGGYMSFELACQLSDRIAAIASVTGSMTPNTYNNCDPQHPTPVLQIHGTGDSTVPYEGSPLWTKSIADVLDYWNTHNQTTTTPTVEQVADSNPQDGSTVEHYVYANGTNCTAVEHYKVLGGEHTWPGAWGNTDINASIKVWNFLSQYDINGEIDCFEENIEDQETTLPSTIIQPNPVLKTMLVNYPAKLNAHFTVYSITGEVMKSGTFNGRSIDVSNIPSGIYYLRLGHITEAFIKSE